MATEQVARQVPVSLALAGLAWVGMTLQEVLLFSRPTPYGGPYVEHWDRYFWFALLFNLIGPLLAVLPALVLWSVAGTRSFTASVVRRVHGATMVLLALVVMLDHADNEVMRFMGTHLTVDLLRTYSNVGAWGQDMWHILAEDRGGAGLPFVILAASPLALWWTGRRVTRAGAGRSDGDWSRSRTALVVVVLLGVPTVVYNLPSGGFRRSRVQPELLTLMREWRQSARAGVPPSHLDSLIGRHRAEWLAESGDTGWQFVADQHYPFLRAPTTVSLGSEPRWNVIYIQLETFRAWNVGHLHPDPRGSATPFLDSLAASPDGATWTRHLSFGPPTVSGFIAGHCSVQPHGARDITTRLTYVSLVCLPALLRAHGWHTAYFTGSDPDWDNQTIWLRRWYDEKAFFRDADEDDRVVFERAADRIREIGRQGQPFFATVVSISNHYPFRSRDTAYDLTDSTDPREAIRNTMHFTDVTVRRFLGALAAEPWFRRTLVVIVGDHGYNLGEHDGTAGQRNGWRESVWVPLIIAGPHPRLPRGRHDEIASLLDLAPTVSDLLGVRQPVPWLGRSLLLPPGPGRTVTMQRATTVFAEDDRFGLVLDPATGKPALYDAVTDPLQQHDIGPAHQEEAARLLERAARDQQLTDFLLEANRIWREPPTP